MSESKTSRSPSCYTLQILNQYRAGESLSRTNRGRFTTGLLHLLGRICAISAIDTQVLAEHLRELGSTLNQPWPEETVTKGKALRMLGKMLQEAREDGPVVCVPWAFDPDTRPRILAHTAAVALAVAQSEAFCRSLVRVDMSDVAASDIVVTQPLSDRGRAIVSAGRN